MGVSQESILFLFCLVWRDQRWEKLIMKSERGGVERVGEEEREGGVEIWNGSVVGKLNVSILTTLWKMRATGGTIVRWDPSVIRRQKQEGWFLTYLTLPMLLFFACSSRRARSCSSARDISSSMLVISSLARRRFSWKSDQIKDRRALKQSRPRWMRPEWTPSIQRLPTTSRLTCLLFPACLML